VCERERERERETEHQDNKQNWNCPKANRMHGYSNKIHLSHVLENIASGILYLQHCQLLAFYRIIPSKSN
jgi:hypothetical protein